MIRLHPWFPLVGVTMGLLCAVLNYRFAFRLGSASSEIDGYILGSIAVVVEVFLWVAPIAGAYHHRQRRFRIATVAWSLWTLCALLSFLNTVGYIATSREATARTASREDAIFGDAAGNTEKLRAALAPLTRRAVSRIEAEIKALPLRKLAWRERSLKSIALEAELAEAHQVEALQAKIEALRPALLAGKPASGDPAASLLGSRLGMTLEDAHLLIAVIFGFTGLAVSSLGPLALKMDAAVCEAPRETIVLHTVRDVPAPPQIEELEPALELPDERPVRLMLPVRW